jgi:hypothetical protein
MMRIWRLRAAARAPAYHGEVHTAFGSSIGPHRLTYEGGVLMAIFPRFTNLNNLEPKLMIFTVCMSDCMIVSEI